MSLKPCGVRLPGGTGHSGHGTAEKALRRALSQVGERTPWRETITTYFNSGFEAPRNGARARRNAASKAAGRLQLTIQVKPKPVSLGGRNCYRRLFIRSAKIFAKV